MKFKLTEKARTRANTTFHVTDSAGDIVGIINFPHGQEDDLLRHWRGAQSPGTPPAAAKAGVPRVRLPALSKKSILRGC